MNKLNKLIILAICALLITIIIIVFNFQSKRYNLLEKDYYKLKTAYDENQKDAKPDELQKLKQKVSNLQDELNSEKEKTSSLKKKLKQNKAEKEPLSTATSSTTNYLKIKYWFDDKNYQLSDEEQKLYKDPYLSKNVSSQSIFVSPTVSEEELENGQTVYSAMTSEGLVYSSEYINLNQLEKTEYSLLENAVSPTENEKYKKIHFCKTEERCLSEDSEQKWYSDYTLSQEVKDSKYLRIVSEIDDFTASNGVQLYCALTKNGDIVYMHESPNLVTINED